MAKPSRDDIQNGLNGWDGTVDNNFIKLFDRPIPIFLHSGDETDIEAGFPAASHDECLVVVDHTTIGLTFYIVDKDHASGSAKWVPLSVFLATPVTVENSDTTLDWDDRFVISNPSGGSATLTLRPAGEMTGKTVQVKNVSSSDSVIVSSASSIDGSTTFTLSAQYQSVTVYSDGATYHIL